MTTPRLTRLGIVLASALAAAALLGVSPLHAQKTDVVIMNNGDYITGEVKKLERGKLDYSTDDMGRLSIEWLKVHHVTSNHYFEVERISGIKHFGQLGRTEVPGELVVILTRPDTMEFDDVVRITPVEATFWQRLSGRVEAGVNFTRANKLFEWTSGFEIKYRGRKWYSRLSGSSYFQTQETTEGTSRNNYTFELQRFMAHRWGAGVTARAEQNQELELDYRTTLGLGGTHRLLQTNQSRLLLSMGATGGAEQFSGTDPAFSGELYLGGDYSLFRYDSPKTDLSVQLMTFASYVDIGRIRFDFDPRVDYELFSDFYLSFVFFWKFDSRPGGDGTKNDYGLNFLLSYKFG
jgi:hypothetical protein